MKVTIVSLIFVALELTLCLVSPRWRLIDLQDSPLCNKGLRGQFNVSSSHHQYLHVGPVVSSRVSINNSASERFSSNHAKTEAALLITGIVLLVVSAIILVSIEICKKKSIFTGQRTWLYLINTTLLMISLVVLIVGYYLVQHHMQRSLNGGAALGFFIGVLFVVMLATHSTIAFWTHVRETFNKKTEKQQDGFDLS